MMQSRFRSPVLLRGDLNAFLTLLTPHLKMSSGIPIICTFCLISSADSDVGIQGLGFRIGDVGFRALPSFFSEHAAANPSNSLIFFSAHNEAKDLSERQRERLDDWPVTETD